LTLAFVGAIPVACTVGVAVIFLFAPTVASCKHAVTYRLHSHAYFYNFLSYESVYDAAQFSDASLFLHILNVVCKLAAKTYC